jgi:hypothetical protein
MRGIFGLVGLLIAMAVAGVLVRQQLKATDASMPKLQAPAAVGEATQSGTGPSLYRHPARQHSTANMYNNNSNRCWTTPCRRAHA